MNVSAVILLLGDIKHWSLRIYKHTVHFTFDAVECNLTEQTAKSISVLLLPSSYWFLHIYAHVSKFHMLIIWVFCLCFEHECSVLFGMAAHHPGSLFRVMGAYFPFLCGGSWLGCQDLPAMGALSIKELTTNSGSPWMSQAPNLYLAMQLLISNLSLCTWSMAVQDTDHSTDARRWKELLCHKALIYCLKPNPKNIHVTKNERSKG